MNIWALLVNTEHLLKSLEIMWKGVVAIFIVIALIIVVTKVVNAICVKADKSRAEKENAAQTEQKQ